jgi:hypothetical protein
MEAIPLKSLLTHFKDSVNKLDSSVAELSSATLLCALHLHCGPQLPEPNQHMRLSCNCGPLYRVLDTLHYPGCCQRAHTACLKAPLEGVSNLQVSPDMSPCERLWLKPLIQTD